MMEGSGGMVAVVQGLKDAGLAVTLLSSRYPTLGQVIANGQGSSCPNQACQTVTDTGTEPAVRDRPTGMQCRSHYQMAHCITSGFSPIRLPQYSIQEYQQYRSFTSRTPDEEAFVESLRKYPTSPVRSRSADLIERMLSYTQSKNGARYTNTRSAKSLPSKETSKHAPLHSDEIPTRDTGSPTNESRTNYGYKRDVELVPVPVSNRKSRYDNQIGMYDYLKSKHKEKKLKASEVRYVTNLKQCLREKLRQLCEEEPVNICPKIQNRYNQHRQKYHGAVGSQKSQKCTTCHEDTTPDFVQDENPSIPTTSKECKVSRVNKSRRSFKFSKACYCNRPERCDCGTQLSRSILKPNAHSEGSVSGNSMHQQCLPVCEYECNKTADPYILQIKEIILTWSRDLPVYANFNATDALKREKVIDELIDAIGEIPKDDMYFEKLEDSIKKGIKTIPMWRPENKVDQESFENQLAFGLLQKIKNIITERNKFKNEISNWVDGIPITRKSIDKETIINESIDKLKPITLKRPLSDNEYNEALKDEITSSLNYLPIEFTGSRTNFINNTADKLVAKLHTIPIERTAKSTQLNIKDIILDWTKNNPELPDGTDIINDDVLINDLITKLNNLKEPHVDNRDQEIINIITNWLNAVEEKKKCKIDRNKKFMLITQLRDKIINQMDQQRENISNAIQKWYDDIRETFGIPFIDYQKDLEILATKLVDIQAIENNENRQNTMRQEILSWLQNLQAKQGRYVESGIQENLVNKLVSMINGEPNRQYVSENGLITQNIWTWLKAQPEFKQDSSSQYRDAVIELSGKLQDIKDKKGEVTENDINAELTNWFEKLSKELIQIELSNQKKLQDKLLSVMSPIKRRKNWEKSINLQELISKEVSDIIDSKLIEGNERKVLKEQITQAITPKWNAIQSTQSNETISKIKNILKQATNLSEPEISALVYKLIEKLKDVTLSSLNSTSQDIPIIFDNNLKRKIRNNVEHILKILSLKDEQQVRDTITDILVKKCEDAETNSSFDVIYELLKKSNVSNTQARKVTNEILEMFNKFKNDVTDTTYQSPNHGSAESLWAHKQMFMQRLEKEITDFMEKLLNESNSFCKKTGPESYFVGEALEDSMNHYNKFKSSALKTSTPTKVDNDRNLNTESLYKNQIKEILRNWITSLIGTIDECFMDDMATDIATDIIDRERYKQLSKAKRSSDDEIEHLKYQIFKWTSKLPNPIDLSTKTAEIKELIKTLQVLGIPYLIRETIADNKLDNDPSMEYSSDIIAQDTGEFIEQNIYGAIWDWLNKITNIKSRLSDDKRAIDNIITELSRKLKNILFLDTQVADLETLCKDEVSNYLKKLNIYQKNTKEQLEHRSSELINFLKNMELFSNILNRNEKITNDTKDKLEKKEAIKQAVQNWCQKLPLKKDTAFEDIKDIVDNLAEAISTYLLITNVENVNIFMDEILKNLKKIPLQFDKGNSKRLLEFTENLIETLKSVLNNSDKYYRSTENELPIHKKPILRNAAEVMCDNIQNWCENLPLDLGVPNADIEQVKMIKQNLAGKLLKKVSELNLDPEIFNDDYLYEDVLKDEIDKILDDVVKSEQLEEVLPILKENLIRDLLNAKEGMKNEIAGFAYKQQLKDAISKTLSSIGLPILEQTSFEILKDNLADAFVSLQYVGDDEELKNTFKDKIFNEINKFCDDYLKRNPATPLNVHKLNEELYKALKRVPIPKEESMRREVEQIRIKDIITEWLKNLPFEEIPSPIQESKIISLLAKRLRDIENEAELNSEINIDDTMNNEITKWLKKFKLKSENEWNADSVKKNLIQKLKATKNNRKFNEKTIRNSINYEDLTNELSLYPPSKLSAEDRAHLQRIRDRTAIERTILKPDNKKDASVSPEPITTGIQTEDKQAPNNYIHQKTSQNASIQTIIREPLVPATITPQVIVKEYYWNSHDSPTMQRSSSILSTLQSPMTQKANTETSHVTTSSQTKPLPVSKATTTQEASIEQLDKDKAIITPEASIEQLDKNKATITQEASIEQLDKNKATITPEASIEQLDKNKATITPEASIEQLDKNKASITQEASIEQLDKTQTNNDIIENPTKGTLVTKSTNTAPQHISNEINIDSHKGRCNQDDYLQLNCRKRAEIKSCRPCSGRTELSSKFEGSPEAGTSKAYQKMRSLPERMGQSTNKRSDLLENRPEFLSAGQTNRHKNCLDNENNLGSPCCMKSMCQPPSNECIPKRIRCSLPSCSCRKPTLNKCTIRPQFPCQYSHHSNKSCYVSKKHCPKCWDGFCPYPSYLYFRQD